MDSPNKKRPCTACLFAGGPLPRAGGPVQMSRSGNHETSSLRRVDGSVVCLTYFCGRGANLVSDDL